MKIYLLTVLSAVLVAGGLFGLAEVTGLEAFTWAGFCVPLPAGLTVKLLLERSRGRLRSRESEE